MRGVEAELHGGLVGVLPEASEQVADLLLAVGVNTTGGGLMDGAGPLQVAVGLEQVGGGQLGLGVQRNLS